MEKGVWRVRMPSSAWVQLFILVLLCVVVIDLAFENTPDDLS